MNNYEYLKIGKYSDLSNSKERRLYRFLEIFPGAFSWGTLVLAVYLSFVWPVGVAIFIIAFDVFWLVKTVYLTLHFRAAFNRIRQNMKVNWLDHLNRLPAGDYSVPVKNWRDIYHLVILPTYKEKIGVISATIESLANANYPKEKLIVVLAQEERAGKEFNAEIANKIISKYGKSFLKLVTVEHPAGIPGELAGKGSNITWAGRYAQKEIIDKMQIPYEFILVSAFDIDTIISPDYFGRLAFVYLTAENPLRASYQPVPFYTNNIWEAPTFARVIAFSTTFWYAVLQERVESSTTFSSHSMPFQALVDVDFWQTNIVSEDSRIFMQCLLRYDGDYRVEPLFYPVTMDANVAPTFWQTIVNIYKQQRRWAWGAESIPYLLFGFYKNKRLPLFKKLFFSFVMIEGFWSWATNAIIIFLLGWLPVVVGGPEFNRNILSFNLPRLTQIIMTIAMVGLITLAIYSIFILPPRPPKYGKLKSVWMILQWFLFPLTSIGLGAIPALDAQTRLMLGKYMGFWVTPKSRKEVD